MQMCRGKPSSSSTNLPDCSHLSIPRICFLFTGRLVQVLVCSSNWTIDSLSGVRAGRRWSPEKHLPRGGRTSDQRLVIKVSNGHTLEDREAVYPLHGGRMGMSGEVDKGCRGEEECSTLKNVGGKVGDKTGFSTIIQTPMSPIDSPQGRHELSAQAALKVLGLRQ